MIRMADTYYEEDSLEKAYILYFKYVTLFIEKIPKHPEYKSAENAKDKKRVMTTIKTVMPRCEEIKSMLRKSYNREHQIYVAHVQEEKRIEEEKKVQEDTIRKQLEGAKLREEVAKYHDEKERHLAEARDREIALWHQYQKNREPGAHSRQTQNQILNDGHKSQISLEDLQIAIDQNLSSTRTGASGASVIPNYDRASKPSQVNSNQSIPLMPDRSTKPNSIMSASNEFVSSGLRRLMVPSILMPTFLSVAELNTKVNVETCGILAGRMSRDTFNITHLIIPKQTGTPDSCTTEGEEELFEVQDKENLITLGWIHTHPTQTAFLSSVDLHTQLSYQLMLPEAVAIVCSPRYNETGFFVLTPDYGLDYIGNCR